jgi:hypothetical protein
LSRFGQTRLADVHIQALGADVRLGALAGNPLAAGVAMNFIRFDRRFRLGDRFGSATQIAE